MKEKIISFFRSFFRLIMTFVAGGTQQSIESQSTEIGAKRRAEVAMVLAAISLIRGSSRHSAEQRVERLNQTIARDMLPEQFVISGQAEYTLVDGQLYLLTIQTNVYGMRMKLELVPKIGDDSNRSLRGQATDLSVAFCFALTNLYTILRSSLILCGSLKAIYL